MPLTVTHAMVLAAGFGQRMQPLTLLTPKPLIAVKGKALIDYGADKLAAAGVETAVVNAHYLPEQIEAWAAARKRPRIVVSDERDAILDTGGGIVRALPLLGSQPFFVLNSDSFWIDGPEPALDRLKRAWDGTRMDCLILACPIANTVGYEGRGDFHLHADGRLTRRRGEETGALAYIGGYLVHPRLFAGAAEAKFSMNVLWDRAIAAGRLYGIAHDGLWLHVGTPGAIAAAEARL